MSIETEVVALLTAGSPSWVLSPQSTSNGTQLPYVIYSVAKDPLVTIHGTVAVTRHTFTFFCWAASQPAAQTIVTDVQTRLDASSLARVRLAAPDGEWNPDVDAYCEISIYDFWET